MWGLEGRICFCMEWVIVVGQGVVGRVVRACVCMGVFVLMMVLLYCFVVKYGIFAVCVRSWCFVTVFALFSGVEYCFV